MGFDQCHRYFYRGLPFFGYMYYMTVFRVGQLWIVAGRSFGMIQATPVGQFVISHAVRLGAPNDHDVRWRTCMEYPLVN